LPRDAVTAVYPWTRANAERSWGEQLYHGRRVLIGFWSVPPAIHLWLSRFSREHGLSATIAAYRELGSAAVEVRLPDLDARDRAGLAALLANPQQAGIRAVERSGAQVLFLLAARPPLLADPMYLSGLVFHGTDAVVREAPGRLVFRLRNDSVDVDILAGAARIPATLSLPVVAVGRMPARLSVAAPAGARVVARRDGALIGEIRAP
jgi:hypothetical protein